ncbi:glycosyltransferase family 4 protein [Shewanella litoralis]|uniref:Glycosyltransferase n=1 Tax=Shewanella litoralis TaxID=2282700 RepID=A0ABQ2RIE4_9GAMM|nr:glycosyltransferase family 4 protein [Shewanella litoralis]GGQ33928.1 putative glycosyltransferase [Shewanella litoralis]
MKNICFFVGDLSNSGGTERVSTVIANDLCQHGYNVHIVSLKSCLKPFFELSPSISYHSFFSTTGSGVFRFPSTIKMLRSYLKRHNIDTLIDVESMLALYALPATVGLNIKHICWEHFNFSVDLGKPSRRLARRLAARFADHVVTLTERDRELWLANMTCNADIRAIANPITIDLPNSVNSDKSKLFLAVGRLTYQKGFDLLLQSWAEVALSNTDWRLRIVGDGEDKLKLEQMCKDLNIINSVEFVSNTNDISAHYQQAAYFVMSSRFEGLPLVLIEAQAFGLPIISFDCDTGPSEIILDNETGWLCEDGNIQALSANLLKAIEISKPVYIELSRMSVDNANRFLPKAIIASWLKLL